MGLKNRISVVLKSQFNHWVTRAEDPEKIMDQAVQEMEEGLDRQRAILAVLKFRVEEQERFLQRIGKQISYWQERAEEFLKEDMEENAKEAVRKRRILAEEERKLKVKHMEDGAKLKEMEVSLNELENRVQMAKTKKNILIKSIKHRSGITVGEGGNVEEGRVIEIKEPFSVFRKMEERMEGDVEVAFFSQDKEKERWEREEKLINEEIEMLKRNNRKGGNKK